VCDDFFCWEQQQQQQQKRARKEEEHFSAGTQQRRKRKVYELVTVRANASKIGARLSLFYRPSVYITAQQLKGKRRRRRTFFFSFFFFFSWRPTTSACGKSYLMLHHSPSGDRWSGHWVFVARQLLAAKRRREIYNHHASPSSAVLLLLHTSI
jgi:hypothetical protein